MTTTGITHHDVEQSVIRYLAVMTGYFRPSWHSCQAIVSAKLLGMAPRYTVLFLILVSCAGFLSGPRCGEAVSMVVLPPGI